MIHRPASRLKILLNPPLEEGELWLSPVVRFEHVKHQHRAGLFIVPRPELPKKRPRPESFGTVLAIFAILLLAAALRLWRLDQNGWGNEYYTAGVRSMMAGWSNFFYNSFDPAGFVSVDKPPVALWIQVLSAKLFGFHGLAVLLPQALEGIIAVWVIYHIVRRYFDTSAGLFAALFLAITPVSVAIDRSSNTDSCLVLVLVLAAWALIRAAETGSRRYLILSMAVIGIGFNVKMLAAFVVLPSFVLVYFLGGSNHMAQTPQGPGDCGRRPDRSVPFLGDCLRFDSAGEPAVRRNHQEQFNAGTRVGAVCGGKILTACEDRVRQPELIENPRRCRFRRSFCRQEGILRRAETQ